MEEIEKLIIRLRKIGIDISLSMNYPWVYLDKVNGNDARLIIEDDYGNMIPKGYCIAALPIRKDQKFKFKDISRIFEIIRKYK